MRSTSACPSAAAGVRPGPGDQAGAASGRGRCCGRPRCWSTRRGRWSSCGDERAWRAGRPPAAQPRAACSASSPTRARARGAVVREQVRSWRFYDHFRTDAEAPARQAQIGTRTPVLDHDGADLAAALQTIREIGDRERAATTRSDERSRRAAEPYASTRGRLELRAAAARPAAAARRGRAVGRHAALPAVVAALLTPAAAGAARPQRAGDQPAPGLLPALARLIGRRRAPARRWSSSPSPNRWSTRCTGYGGDDTRPPPSSWSRTSARPGWPGGSRWTARLAVGQSLRSAGLG